MAKVRDNEGQNRPFGSSHLWGRIIISPRCAPLAIMAETMSLPAPGPASPANAVDLSIFEPFLPAHHLLGTHLVTLC